MNKAEETAAIEAGKLGGEYLESINKFDLRALNENEWKCFLGTICREYSVKLDEEQSKLGPIPF